MIKYYLPGISKIIFLGLACIPSPKVINFAGKPFTDTKDFSMTVTNETELTSACCWVKKIQSPNFRVALNTVWIDLSFDEFCLRLCQKIYNAILSFCIPNILATFYRKIFCLIKFFDIYFCLFWFDLGIHLIAYVFFLDIRCTYI